MSEAPYFLRLPEVLKIIPVSKSTWWEGVRCGKYPRPVKLSKRTSAWRRSDVLALCDLLSGAVGPEGQRLSSGPEIRDGSWPRPGGRALRTR